MKKTKVETKHVSFPLNTNRIFHSIPTIKPNWTYFRPFSDRAFLSDHYDKYGRSGDHWFNEKRRRVAGAGRGIQPDLEASRGLVRVGAGADAAGAGRKPAGDAAARQLRPPERDAARPQPRRPRLTLRLQTALDRRVDPRPRPPGDLTASKSLLAFNGWIQVQVELIRYWIDTSIQHINSIRQLNSSSNLTRAQHETRETI